MTWGRRDIIQAAGTVALLPAGLFDIFGDDSEEAATQEDLQLLREELRDFKQKAITSESDPAFQSHPAASIEQYPLTPGSDVEIHHSRPEAGAFLSEVSGAFQLDMVEETHPVEVPAASSGTQEVPFNNSYELAIPVLFPPGGSVLSDVTVEKAGWIKDNTGAITGFQVNYNNSSTQTVEGKLEVYGFG